MYTVRALSAHGRSSFHEVGATAAFVTGFELMRLHI